MKVQLRIFDGVVGQGRQTFALDVEPGASVRELARQVGAPLERIGLVTVDGRVCRVDHRVEAGQRICLFPHVMGG
jgi:hypothetical protein